MNLSRRSFLLATVATGFTMALPAPAMAPALEAAVAKPTTTIWVGGHYGEFDWHPFNGESKRDVVRQLFYHHGHGNDEEIELAMTMTDEELEAELKALQIDIQRVPKMDGKQPDEITGADWIKAGLGTFCERCDGECFAGDGAIVFKGEVVCEECITFKEQIEVDPDLAEERLMELIYDEDFKWSGVREVLDRQGISTKDIPTGMWKRAIKAART